MTSSCSRLPRLRRGSLLVVLSISLGLSLGLVAISILSPAPSYYVNAQEPVKVRPLQAEFLAEPGSPIDVTLAKTELDLDPFDIPLASRIYIDYKNISDRPVSAVKFRIRFTDESGKDRGTFHAPDMSPIGPGQQRSQKWRHEKVDPRSTQIKVRALQVKFADGSSWQSTKMQELAQPPTSGIVDSAPQATGFPPSGNGSYPLPQGTTLAPSGTQVFGQPPSGDIFPPNGQSFPPPMNQPQAPPAQPQQAPPTSTPGTPGGAGSEPLPFQ